MILAWAMMIPAKVEFIPRVQLVPTAQKTLAYVAPLIKTTRLLVAVVMAVPTWKIKKGFEPFWPSRVTGPVIPSVVPT